MSGAFRQVADSEVVQRPRSAPRLSSAAHAALEDGNCRLTYAQLQPLVRLEARWLRAQGVRRCGLFADNSVSWAVSDLALREARMMCVPLPAYFNESQLEHILADAGIDAVLTDQPVLARERWPAFAARAVSRFTGLTLLQRMGRGSEATEIASGAIKVTYTSGSTAEPKGVCLPAAAIDAVAQSLAQVTAPLRIQRHLCLLPLPTLLENLAGILAPLLSGATCVLAPLRDTGISHLGVDTPRLLSLIDRTRPQSLILVPELLRVLVGAVHAGWRAPDSLRFIAVGGAAVSVQLLRDAAQAQLPVFQGYGLSECASVVCLGTPGANRIGSVGRALPHASIRRDENGHLRVRGALMTGYLGGPRLSPGAEYDTGDLGEIDDEGYVYVSGRARNVFITSHGRNVTPEWIERELTQEAEIRFAVAHGEAQPGPVALIARSHESVPDSALASAIRRANARLPDYARIRNWAAMPLAPSAGNGLLTANGRLRRDRILELCAPVIQSLHSSAAAQGTTT